MVCSIPNGQKHDIIIIIIIIIISQDLYYRSWGPKTMLTLEQMLERLHFVLEGSVGEGTQHSDCIVALNW